MYICAGRQQQLRPLARKRLLEDLVCETGISDSGLRLQGESGIRSDPFEPLIDLGVDAGDKERCDGLNLRQLKASGLGLLEAGQVRVDDFAVALEAEDQRDVDADALRGECGDSFQALNRSRDLDHDVRTVHLVPELTAIGDGSCSVVGEPWLDLDGDSTIHTARRIIDRTQDVASGRDVVRRDLENGFGNGLACCREFGHLGVVRVALGERTGEDGRICGDADDVSALNQLVQSAGDYAFTRQVVEPDADSCC